MKMFRFPAAVQGLENGSQKTSLSNIKSTEKKIGEIGIYIRSYNNIYLKVLLAQVASQSLILVDSASALLTLILALD